MLTAAEVRKNASQYNEEIYKMHPEFELWGTVTGRSIPFHRKWWLLRGNEIVGHLDQGCYENGQIAGRDRARWALGLMEQLIGKDELKAGGYARLK